ncbi:probable transcriptional regulatory protein rxt3 at N-terminal half [Coccomyxa sp. Obi]|nr:probable transcriptional regulatory protein rxt3 at N-terminal half [Coccomyxa sp. Obi]
MASESSDGLVEHLANGRGGREKREGGEEYRSEEDEKSKIMRRSSRPKTFPKRSLRNDEPLPVLMYKEGEPLKDLSKFLVDGEGKYVEVRIPAECMSNANRQVRARQLWGNEIYTQDSDLVAVLMHGGYYNQALSAPPSSVAEVRAIVQPLPPQPAYQSSARNSIRSRAWGTAVEGCSYRVERCTLVSRSGVLTDLEPSPDGAAAVVPTFTPAQFERAMNTRAAASSMERRQRTMTEVTIQYNLCNEPWLKYSMAAVADRGLKPSQWTSARLHKEVIYLETQKQRYELSRVETPSTTGAEPPPREVFRWARCRRILTQTQLRRVGMPLPESYLDVLEPALAWEDLQWSPTGVAVKGKSYQIVRLHFTKQTRHSSVAEAAADDTAVPMES